MLTWLSLLAGCGVVDQFFGGSESAQADVDNLVAEEPAAPTRFVAASSLNIRARPDGEATGRLTINTPLEVLGAEKDFTHVRVANGTTGWVATEYLADEALTPAQALSKVSAAEDPKDRLAWAQRAAALDVRNRDALAALASAYRDLGEDTVAERVEAQLDWPADIALSGPREANEAGELLLEWRTQHGTPMAVVDGARFGAVEVEEATRAGFAPGRDIWVLPDRSPAVKATVVGVDLMVFNECAGSIGYLVRADAALPEGERAVAWTLSDPPASWAEPAPSVDEEAIAELVRAQLPERFVDPEVSVAPGPGGARVRVAQDVTTDTEDFFTTYLLADYRVVNGNVQLLGGVREEATAVGYERPTVGRDVDGDGTIDTLTDSECMAGLEGEDGAYRVQTEGLCCGC